MHEKMVKRKDDRQRLLMPAQNRVTRQNGTDPAPSCRHREFNASGLFHCVCCGNVLVSSHAKIVATYKWPEFLDPKAKEHVRTANDILSRTVRNDVLCSNCNAHLGYVCNDGRLPAGVHYFINSVVLTFDESGGRNAETALASNERTASIGERGPV
jgi:peptide-methionine (R)-S-oxide reductase